MSRQHKIITDSLVLGLRQAAGLALVALQTLFAARFLGPAGFGTFAILQVLVMMAAVGNPGYLAAAFRELPHHRATGNATYERVVFNHAAAGELAFAALWTVVIAVAALLQADPELRLLLLIVAASVIPAKLVALYQLLAYADKAFDFQSRGTLAIAAITAALVIGLVWKLGLIIVLLAPTLANLAGILYYRSRYRLALRLELLERSEFQRLTGIGLPMAGLAVATGNNGLQRWIERSLISVYLGQAALGVFAFFVWISLALHTLLGGLIQAIQPHLYELAAEPLDGPRTERVLLKPMWSFAVVGLLAIGLAMTALPDVIAAILAEYLSGLAVMYVLLAASFVTCLYWIPGVLLSAVRFNAQLYYLAAWCVAIAVSTGAALILLRAGWGSMSLALAYLLSQLIVLALTYRRLWNVLFAEPRAFRAFAGSHALPLANTVLAAAALAWLWPLEPGAGTTSHLLAAAIKGLLFMVLALPTLVQLERKTALFSNHVRPLLAGIASR
jgi:O-antigen/teichoic acid export membrane protein